MSVSGSGRKSWTWEIRNGVMIVNAIHSRWQKCSNCLCLKQRRIHLAINFRPRLPAIHLIHLPQERPVALAGDRSEVVNVPPEVVVRREPRRRELRLDRRIVELETREPVGK